MHKFALLSLMLWIAATTSGAASRGDTEALSQAHSKLMEFREGNLAVAKPVVKSLEDATARSPDNAKLWELLGHAYMAYQGSMYSAEPDMPAMIATVEHAQAAYARSLTLQPKNPLAHASHGMSTMVVSQLKGDGPGLAAGIDEMNAAVRSAPNSTAVRLTRGFTIIHLPPAMRDTKAVIEDLGFILDTAPGGRPEDVLHVLLGDVHAEMGDNDAARKEYRQVTGASAFAAEQVKSRLADLDKGPIRPDSIAQVRFGTGTRCAMCHAPGTDN